jgi:hypothetical protein
MTISATLFGLSLGTITPARATLAIALGASGYAWIEHRGERIGDVRPLAALLAAVLFVAWGIDVRADDGPVGIAGPVIEALLGAGLVGGLVVAWESSRALLASRRARARRLPVVGRPW